MYLKITLNTQPYLVLWVYTSIQSTSLTQRGAYNISDFLFAPLDDIALPKWDLLLKQRISHKIIRIIERR